MAVVNRALIAKELRPGLNALIMKSYKLYDQEDKLIFAEQTSEKAYEEDVMLYGTAAAQVKGEGAAIAYDVAGEAWTARYVMETVALAAAVTEEAMEDNLYLSLSKRMGEVLARSQAHTKQTKAAAILNNGFTTFTTGDGVALFSTSHPLTSGGTFANRPSTDVDLSETGLEAACIAIHGFVDERGLKMVVKPNRLVIPRQLVFEAERILKSELRVGTADNDVNALKSTGYIPGGWAVNHYLTDPDAWFLTTDVPDGFKKFQRRPLRTEVEDDFDTGNLRIKTTQRYAYGASDPRCAYASTGA